MRPVAITGAAAVSAYGEGWRGLGRAIGDRAALPGVPAEAPLASPKARKMMSRGAYLAARCLALLGREVAWAPEARGGAGYFLGVGASGGALEDVTALLDASIVDGGFSLARFGADGLGACNPLLAFQLMNNFTMCHGAILEGLGGPNGALFSRGAGTAAALIEAVHAIREGDCERAVAGGADSAVHPVTRAELARDGFVARGLVPAEGAGLVALEAGEAGLAIVEGAGIAGGADAAAIDEAVAGTAGGVDLVVIAPWGPPAGEVLRAWVADRVPGALVVDASAVLGDALAATPALAWLAALDLLAAGRAARALVLSAGTDGDVGAVLLARPPTGGAA